MIVKNKNCNDNPTVDCDNWAFHIAKEYETTFKWKWELINHEPNIYLLQKKRQGKTERNYMNYKKRLFISSMVCSIVLNASFSTTAQEELNVSLKNEQEQGVNIEAELMYLPAVVSASNIPLDTIPTTITATPLIPTKIELQVNNLTTNKISVSCIKVEWENTESRQYDIAVTTNELFPENIHLTYKNNNLCYITGLRENSEYTIVVTPLLNEGEKAEDFKIIPTLVIERTEQIEIIQEYEREDGTTNCFAGESASGLTLMPSSGAIEGSITDPITDTGIRRNEYGDYCVAMGLWYGKVGERFLVELENGIQFTVAICDSKGMAADADGDGIADGRFHWFGGDGKCVIEFIYEGDVFPSNVANRGSWGYNNWNGLNLTSNILKIQKINFGETVQY